MKFLANARKHWGRIVFFALFMFVFFGNQGFHSLVRNWLELRRLRGEITTLQREEAQLEHKQELLRTGDSSLERLARKELGFIKSGEIEYRFPPPKVQ